MIYLVCLNPRRIRLVDRRQLFYQTQEMAHSALIPD